MTELTVSVINDDIDEAIIADLTDEGPWSTSLDNERAPDRLRRVYEPIIAEHDVPVVETGAARPR